MLKDFSLQQGTGIAVIVAAIIGACALVVNALQLKLNRDFQKQAATKLTYREYLKLAVEYPKFGDGNNPTFANEDEESQYQWFVSFFLLAAEEVLEYASRDTYWVEAIKEEMARHRAYLESSYFLDTEIHFYSNGLQKTVREIVGSKRVVTR